MQLMEIPDLAEAIRHCPASVSELSRRSGVSRQAIMWIRDGRTDNPGVKTVQAIQEALDQVENSPQPSEKHQTETGDESASQSASGAAAASPEGAHSPSSGDVPAVGVGS